jgi:hypothetical protein
MALGPPEHLYIQYRKSPDLPGQHSMLLRGQDVQALNFLAIPWYV